MKNSHDRPKGTKKQAHLKAPKTPAMKRNKIEKIIREAAIRDLRSTIYAANARSIVKRPRPLKRTG